MKKPLISVVMPVYNESIKDLSDSINSILNQSFNNFEYVIIDDNPSNYDIKSYIKKRALKDKRIKLFFNKHNLKLSRTENKGIRVSHGKYIARMDADDIAYPNRLKEQLLFTKKNKLDFVFSNFSIINNSKQLTRRLTFGTNDIVNQHKIRYIMSKTNVAIGPLFFFKKSVFSAINGYRNMNSEDYDFIARSLIYGFKAGYQAKPLIYKRLRKNGISFDTLFDQYIIIHTISYYLKKFHYTKIMPMYILKYNLQHINQMQRRHYEEYANARYNFNDKKSLMNFVLVLKSILVSKVVFKRCLCSLLNKLKIKL